MKWKWLACCIDCDGCITMSQKYRKIERYIAFSNDNFQIMKRFGELVKVGRIRSFKSYTPNHRNELHYQWIIQKDEELVKILPYLIPHLLTIKKKRAKILLEFAKSRLKQRRKFSGIYKSRIPYSDEEKELFFQMRNTFKESGNN